MAFRELENGYGGRSFVDTSAIVGVFDVVSSGEAQVYLSCGTAFTVRGTAEEFMQNMGLDYKPQLELS